MAWCKLACATNRRGDPDCPAQWQQHAVYADCLGSSQQRAQILWILDHIQNQHKKRLSFLTGPFQDVGQRHIRIAAGFQRHTLGILFACAGAFGQCIDLWAGYAFHA
jgi:hypothetical protein